MSTRLLDTAERTVAVPIKLALSGLGLAAVAEVRSGWVRARKETGDISRRYEVAYLYYGIKEGILDSFPC